MNDSRASSDEMPGFPFPSLPGREPDEPLLDMILDGQQLPADAPYGMVALAGGLARLGRPAGPGELPGEAAAMSAFSRSAAGASVSPAEGEPALRKPARRPPPRRRAARLARLASGLLVVMVGLGSAAYADVLPGPVQDFAHHVIDAPPAHSSGEHQKAGQHARRATSPGSARHPAHPAHPAHPVKPGKASKPGKAKGKAKHGFRRTPGKGHHHGKPTHPRHRAHPAPMHPAHSAQP